MDTELLMEVSEKVGGLHAKLDAYHEEMREVRVRVGRLERKWAKLTGIVAAITFPVSALVAYLKSRNT